MAELFGSDAYAPREIAARVQQVGVAKARLPVLTMFSLAVLAGGFIGLGALGFVLVKSDAALSFAVAQLLGGAVFSLGLFLVLVAGAELFTGNNLLVMAWASGQLTTREVLRNWLVVGAGNAVGALGLAVLVVWSHHPDANKGAIEAQYLAIAGAKVALPWPWAIARGVLCNVLVCLGVWLAFAGRSVVDKLAAVVLPVTVFVAAGFEHSVANAYFLGVAALLQDPAQPVVTWPGALGNLIPVVLGNVLGGAGLVGLVYWLVYVRGATSPAASAPSASSAPLKPS